MIASLRGTCIDIAGSSVVIEVGGVGYLVTVTPAHALTMRHGTEVFVRTAMIVREDEHLLFGFESTDALRVFDLLRSVSGVGPKSALGVLGAMDPAQIANAVAHDDDAAFRKVSGIGPKTAKLIIVALSASSPPSRRRPRSGHPHRHRAPASEDVVTALVGLAGVRKRLAVPSTTPSRKRRGRGHGHPGVAPSRTRRTASDRAGR